MKRKKFLMLALALMASLSLLTACGGDDPEPSPKPASGYFTYYLVTNDQTLAAMQITATLHTDAEDKSGEVTADKCITMAEVTDPLAKASLQMGLRNFKNTEGVLVYRVKFAEQSGATASLTYGLKFVPKELEASAPNPDLGYGSCITFTPNVGSTSAANGTFTFTQGVYKSRLQDYANLQNSYNEPRTQVIHLTAE